MNIEHLKVMFNRFRNILRKGMKDTENNYFQHIFMKFIHHIKRTWSVINESLHREKINIFKDIPSQWGNARRSTRNSKCIN